MANLITTLKSNLNALIDSITDPVKVEKLKIKELEEAINQAEEQGAFLIGKPEMLEKEIKVLQEKDEQLTKKITELVNSGEKGEALALKYIDEQSRLQIELEKKLSEIDETKKMADEWFDKIKFLKSALKERKDKSSELIARSVIADSQQKLNKSTENLTSLLNDEPSDLERKVLDKEQKAIGYDKLSGFNDKVEEDKILHEARNRELLAKKKKVPTATLR